LYFLGDLEVLTLVI